MDETALLDVERRLAQLEARVATAEDQTRSILGVLHDQRPVINEHDDRLDDHERRLGGLATVAHETRKVVATLGDQVGRLVDAETVRNLTLARIDRNVAALLDAMGGRVPPESLPTPPVRPHHGGGVSEDSSIRRVEADLEAAEKALDEPEEPT